MAASQLPFWEGRGKVRPEKTQSDGTWRVSVMHEIVGVTTT
jgi:hypothetical protein